MTRATTGNQSPFPSPLSKDHSVVPSLLSRIRVLEQDARKKVIGLTLRETPPRVSVAYHVTLVAQTRYFLYFAHTYTYKKRNPIMYLLNPSATCSPVYWTSCNTTAKEHGLTYYLPIAGEEGEEEKNYLPR